MYWNFKPREVLSQILFPFLALKNQNKSLNFVDFETWSSAGILPATTIRTQDAPSTLENYGSENRCGLSLELYRQYNVSRVSRPVVGFVP